LCVHYIKMVLCCQPYNVVRFTPPQPHPILHRQGREYSREDHCILPSS
jgi:hypothetical protein